MGFRLEIDDGKSDILRKLRLSPNEIFGKPYGGYLFFLIGQTDNEILEWLAQNTVILDSLTGDDIAFVVFARRINVKLKTHDINRSRPPQVTTVDMDDVIKDPSLERLVKSGKCGWVLDGDEINAITYAVDDVAKKFEVLTDLPCVLILDAIPRQNFELFHLDTTNVRGFVQLLRQVIKILIEMPEYKVLMNNIRYVIQIQSEKIELSQNISELVSELDGLDYTTYFKSAQGLIPEFRAALLTGNIRKFASVTRKHVLKQIAKRDTLDKAIDKAKESIDLLLKYSNTIQRMSQYERNYVWPLTGDFLENYLQVYQKYVRSLLLDVPTTPNIKSSQHCTELIKKLQHQQNELINSILGFLPTDDELREGAENLVLLQRNELQIKISAATERKQKIETAITLSVKGLYPLDKASFMQIFAKEASKENRRTMIRQIKNKVAVYAGSWMRPEVIMEMAKPLMS